jgi:Ser/Thr protein kinase RdoA (MazF antagonist)
MMHPQLLSSACQLYTTSPDLLIPLSGGNSNAVYKFPIQDRWQVSETCQVSKHGVLRIGVEDCPAEQTLGMLEWVRFLSNEGAPVTAPLSSTNNRLLENLEHDGTRYTVTAFEKAEGTLAEKVPPSEWTEHLFHSIGKAVGKFHRISKRYQPSSHTLTRPLWFDSYEIHHTTNLLGKSSDPARGKLASLVSELMLLPSEPKGFSLIHGDLHFANFLIQPDGQITIIDFDDCVYGWFAMDVAMALFDVLVLYNPATEEHKQQFAVRFMSNYLSGYRLENDLSQFWQSQIPKFLELKELCIYADLIGHADITQSTSWGGRFMRDRSARIANDIPYVDIDFANL